MQDRSQESDHRGSKSSSEPISSATSSSKPELPRADNGGLLAAVEHLNEDWQLDKVLIIFSIVVFIVPFTVITVCGRLFQLMPWASLVSHSRPATSRHSND